MAAPQPKNNTSAAALMSFLLTAFGLMLVIEGLMPLIAPGAWRGAFRRVLEMNDGQIRFIGMGATLAGCAILLFA